MSLFTIMSVEKVKDQMNCFCASAVKQDGQI